MIIGILLTYIALKSGFSLVAELASRIAEFVLGMPDNPFFAQACWLSSFHMFIAFAKQPLGCIDRIQKTPLL